MGVSESNYISIQGWMVTELDLHGDDLLTFAIVHGFSQDGHSVYRGGRAYVAQWLGCGDKKAGAILQKLTDAGLIERKRVKGEKGWATYQYRSLMGAQNAHIDDANGGAKRPSMGAQNAHINIKGTKKEYKGSELWKSGKECGKPTYPFTCPDCGRNVYRNTAVNYDECPGCLRVFQH